MKQWSFTTIQHGPRKSLGLDLNEYAVLDLIYKDQTYPSSGGVSRLSVQQIASILGLSKGGVHGLIQRMIESKFVEMMPDGARKATPKFYETAYFDRSENERQRSESERNRSENERVYKEVIKVNKVNKAPRKKREAEKVEDKFAAVDGLKDKIGDAQYNLLNRIAQNETDYKNLRELYRQDKFRFLRDWLQYRKERKNPYKIPAPIRLIVSELLRNSKEDCADGLRASIMSQYTGLFIKSSNHHNAANYHE